MSTSDERHGSIQYLAVFENIPWSSPLAGIRHKCFDQKGIRLRLVEYSREMPAHWCETGHYGYVIEGKMEIEFENSKAIYSAGDGIFIPNGAEHKHRGRLISDKAAVFFVENV